MYIIYKSWFGTPNEKNIHEKPEYDEIFHRLGPVNGKISGSSARPELMKSKLPNSVSFQRNQRGQRSTIQRTVVKGPWPSRRHLSQIILIFDQQSSLQFQVLGKVWKLADYDKDGFLDDEEFALAKHLIKIKLNGDDLPAKLPDHLIPPGQRAGGF